MKRREPWPDDRTEYLRAALKTDASLHRIADDMSKHFDVPISRSALIGKAHRLGEDLKMRNAKPDDEKKPTTPRRGRPRKVAEPQAHPAPPTPLPPQAGPRPGEVWLTFEQLKHDSCRYPFGPRPPFLFCGTATQEPPYCVAHAELCYPRLRLR